MWPWLRYATEIASAAWDKLLKAAPPRVWAIILGAPPLCAMAAWVIALLAHLAVQPEPVRLPIVMAIANMGYLTIVAVLVIIASLAAVSLIVRGPGGWQVGINDDDPEPTRLTTTTTTETVVTPPAPKESSQ